MDKRKKVQFLKFTATIQKYVALLFESKKFYPKHSNTDPIRLPVVPPTPIPVEVDPIPRSVDRRCPPGEEGGGIEEADRYLTRRCPVAAPEDEDEEAPLRLRGEAPWEVIETPWTEPRVFMKLEDSV